MPLFIKMELSGHQSRQSIKAHVPAWAFILLPNENNYFLSILSVPLFLIVPIP